MKEGNIKRLFVGIPIPESFTNQIVTKLNGAYDLSFLKLIPKDNYHVTLLFIGNIHENDVPQLVQTLKTLEKNYSSFHLESDKITLMPYNRRARMIWLRFKNSSEFGILANEMKINVLKGTQIKDIHPVPHITLARIKAKLPPLEDIPDFGSLNFELNVKEFVLYESILNDPKGAHYKPVHHFYLR